MGTYQKNHYKENKQLYQAYFFLKRNKLKKEPFEIIPLEEITNQEQVYYIEDTLNKNLDNKKMIVEMYESLKRDRDKRIFMYMLNELKVEEIRKIENISKQRASQLCKRIKEELKNKFYSKI